MAATAQYAFAYNNAGNLVEISTLEKSTTRNEVFTCLSCGRILVPVLGEKRIKHFRHKIEENCSPETYLHKLGKQYFYDLYTQCLQDQKPFHITLSESITCTHFKESLGLTCQLDGKAETYDLTKYYKDIQIEQRDGSFIPDVLLTSASGDTIYIEIFVTHESSREKRQSGSRIIEIRLNAEDDLHVFSDNRLSNFDNRVRFHNFKTSKNEDHCKGRCLEKHNVFEVYPSGKSRIVEKTLKEIWEAKQNNQNGVIYSRIAPYADGGSFIGEIIKAHRSGVPVRNCFLCRYHGESFTENHPIYCKFLKKTCNSNEAANCTYYRADPNVFSQYEDEESPF